MEPFIGEIRTFGFNFAPRGWARCDGSILPISQHSALFSLIGTIYGGDGRTTFALPDLRGRSAVHEGQGPGLTPRTIGERGGRESVVLTPNELPSHTHALTGEVTASLEAEAAVADRANPRDNMLAISGRDTIYAAPGEASNFPMHPDSISVNNTLAVGATGGGVPVGVQDPYLVLNVCIALVGVFPSRN